MTLFDVAFPGSPRWPLDAEEALSLIGRRQVTGAGFPLTGTGKIQPRKVLVP